MNSLPFKKIAGFDIIKQIGQGAMGRVYLAKQISMDRLVAVKILPDQLTQNQVYIHRFIREARTAAKLNHPHIINAIDVGEFEGYYYFAMEYVPSLTLKEHMESRGALTETYCAHVIKQIVSGLDHAAQEGIIHRDIKPENILLTSAASREDHVEVGTFDDMVKIADLGLAKYEDGQQADVTQAGTALGTPYYISPEQALGEKDIDLRSDLYSLGATFFHMVTGQPPFSGDTIGQIMTAHVSKPVPDPRKINSRISRNCARIIMKMMQKKPEDRYPDTASLLADLEFLETEEDERSLPSFEQTLIDHPPSRLTTARKNPLIWSGVVLCGSALLYFFIKTTPRSSVDTLPPIASQQSDSPLLEPQVSLLDKMALYQKSAENSAKQPFTSRITFWQSVHSEMSSSNDPDRWQVIKKIEDILKNLKAHLEQLARKGNDQISKMVHQTLKNEQWTLGANLIQQWPQQLEKLYPQENFDSAYWQPQQQAMESEFWSHFRSQVDKQFQTAWKKQSLIELTSFLENIPSSVMNQGSENSFDLNLALKQRLNQLKHGLNQSQRLRQLKKESQLLYRWNPQASVQDQLDQLARLLKASPVSLSHLNSQKLRDQWTLSLKQWQQCLEDSLKFRRALDHAIPLKKSLTLLPGSRNRYPLKSYKPSTGNIEIGTSLKKMTLQITHLSFDLLQQFRSISFLKKLEIKEKEILASDKHAFHWLIATRQFDLAQQWLQSKSLAQDFQPKKHLLRRAQFLLNYPLPHRFEENSQAFIWSCDFAPPNWSQWFFDQTIKGISPVQPLETNKNSLILHGRALTFWPVLKMTEPWSFEGIVIPQNNDTLKIILQAGELSWIYTIYEGGVHLKQTDNEGIHTKTASVIRDSLPALWRLENKNNTITLWLNQEEMIALPTPFQKFFQLSLQTKTWPLQHLTAQGVPTTRLLINN